MGFDSGIEHTSFKGGLVPVGGKLPFGMELPTSRLLDVLQTVFPDSRMDRSALRKKANSWLYSRTRPGFYFEFNQHIHIAYADQRDGRGSQHYWRLFFDAALKERVEQASRANALALTSASPKAPQDDPPKTDPFRNMKEWGGMFFRSEAEIKIAEELNQRKVLYFANVRGRISGDGSPISSYEGTFNGRIEIDFIVFKGGKALILEVDGQQHSEGGQTLRDYARDRLMLREGIPVARFTAQDCINRAVEVVNEFLNLFS
ncbi:MAG: DUF559 domain-containing protein [Synechococcaceae cyanobacterium SM2_3_2]|nr:DUF559 domain-containing protein [Synechococcaceae cyanobacterium SM2_3_2]